MTAPPQTIHVPLASRSYDIRIGTGNLDTVGSFLTSLGKTSHAVLITDENVRTPHAETVAASLAEAGVQVDMIVVDPGEASKSADVAAGLWEGLLQVGADRKTVVVAVGGGVVGDLAGFIAATFARGVRFFQAPTTLLAQVDSSVGGKVGINLPEAKNMVGAFKQPMGVLIDTATLDTLPDREYRAGLAEVVKYGVILDADFFTQLENSADAINRHEAEILVQVIAHCCRLKAEVVAQDETETTGLRAMLNYGHTFGHAFEALSGYGEILHGEAVAMGMLLASDLAERLGRIDAEVTGRQRRLLEKLSVPTEPPSFPPDRILETMMHDKKVEHGRLRFILPSRMGHVELVADVPEEHVRSVLAS